MNFVGEVSGNFFDGEAGVERAKIKGGARARVQRRKQKERTDAGCAKIIDSTVHVDSFKSTY